MRFIITEKEMGKICILQKHVDGVVSTQEAINLLSCSRRTFFRYKKAFTLSGPPGLIHGLTGKPSNHNKRTSKHSSIRRIIIQPKFAGYGPTFLAERLEEIYGILINKETLRIMMIKEGTRIAKPKKKKVKRIAREAKPQYGMLIQFDGSYHDWLGTGEIGCLLCAVDDASKQVVDAVFSRSKNIEEISRFWIEYFKSYGKPQAVYLDRHASYKVNYPQDQFNPEMLTRFQRAMQKLGVEVIYAKSPEGKGRIERSFRTHQDRLVKLLKWEKIQNYHDANKYLKEHYIKIYNQQFGKKAKKEGDAHRGLQENEANELVWYFAKEEERILKRDGTISYKGKRYQIKKGEQLYNGNKIHILKSIENEIRMRSGLNDLSFTQLPS